MTSSMIMSRNSRGSKSNGLDIVLIVLDCSLWLVYRQSCNVDNLQTQ